MKIQRIVSGLILIIIVGVILILGNTTAVNLATSIVAIIAINEYFNIFKGKRNVDKWVGNILAILIAFMNVIPTQILVLEFLTAILLLFLKVILTQMKTNFEDIAVSAFGIFYIIGFIIFVPMLFRENNGRLLIWYIAISAWVTDTFAYLVGSKLGKHKLTKISPKKSVEGSIAGTLGAVIVAVVYTYFINKYANIEVSYFTISGIILLLSILGQIGDLAASSIKRYIGIKDFSNLIPGHGGMIDRIDSILFIAPFAYFLFSLI